MPEARFSFSSQGADKYRELAKRLRKAGRKDLRSALRKHIIEAGGPVLDEVKSAARNVHVTGSRGGGTKQRRTFSVDRAVGSRKASTARRKHGLRESVARAAKLQITAKAVRFLVSSAAMPPDQRTLPRHLDSPKGWRHPTFGGDLWVHQKGQPYFAVTIKKRAPRFRSAIRSAMDEIRRQLEG